MSGRYSAPFGALYSDFPYSQCCSLQLPIVSGHWCNFLAWSPTLIARLDSKWFTLSRNKFLRIVICKVWPWASNISITWELIRNTCMHAFQSCLTFGDPIDCNPPGFSVHGILQVRILEWVAISFSKKHISCAKFNGSETLGVELNNLSLARQS